jgi:predicted MFS family arabinose efflux permease
MPASLTFLVWLTVGAFAIGTEGFMIVGLLPALARDLNVGVPAAGHLVTAFSLAYAISAPVMAVLTSGLERRRLLAIAMGGFALANLIAGLAPGYAGLLAARLLLALSAASFMPAASGYAAALGGQERGPRPVYGHERANLGDHRRCTTRSAGGGEIRLARSLPRRC